MLQSSASPLPHELLISVFKDSKDLSLAINEALKCLVEILGVDCASICLIDDDRFKVAYRINNTAEPRRSRQNILTPQQSMLLVLKGLAGDGLAHFANSANDITEWHGYFDLCGDDCLSNYIVFLAAGGSISGFLSLQSLSDGTFEKTYLKLIANTADALSVLLDMHGRISLLELQIDTAGALSRDSRDADNESFYESARDCPDCSDQKNDLEQTLLEPVVSVSEEEAWFYQNK